MHHAWFGGGQAVLNVEVIEIVPPYGAQLGQADEAIALLTDLLHKPGDITAALLRADPVWIPLRSDPRFQELVAAK